MRRAGRERQDSQLIRPGGLASSLVRRKPSMAKRYGPSGSDVLRDAADVLGASKIPAGSLKKSLKSPEVQNAAVQ